MGQEAVQPARSRRPADDSLRTSGRRRLRAAIPHGRPPWCASPSGSSSAGSATYPEETHALVSRLRDLLGGLKAIDHLLLRAVPTSSPPAFAEVERLQATLAGIQLGWKRHVQSRFEGAKVGLSGG